MTRIDVDRLLAEDAWLRRLARRLVADASDADDAAQQAWVAALTAPHSPDSPESVRSLRSWLGGVLRNVRAASSRRDLRREARELRTARDEALAATDEVVLELALRRAVTDALLALEEPCREVVFRRFYRDESLKAIAARQGISLSTAHARLERGLAALRQSLDARHGGERRAWALGLASLAAPKFEVGALVAGGLAMGTAFKVAAALVVAAGVGVWLARNEPQKTSEVAVPSAAGGNDVPVLPASIESPQVEPSRRTTEVSNADEPPSTVVDAPAYIVRGRVIDTSGAGVEGVVVTFVPGGGDAARAEQGPARAATSTDGSFAIAAPPAAAAPGPLKRAGRFAIEDPGYTLLAQSADGEVVSLLVSPRRRYAGVVLDASDAPVAAASLTVNLRQDLFRELGLAHVGRSPFATSTAADGTFELIAVGGNFADLRVDAPGLLPAQMELPAYDDAAMVIRLALPTGELELTGVVLDPQGRPVAGAKVSAGDEIATSAADGHFALTWNPTWKTTAVYNVLEDGSVEVSDPQSHLVALHRGFLPARLELAPEHAREPIVLVLGEPLSIEGRVVDENGESFEGVVLWMPDRTHFGRKVIGDGLRGLTVAWGVEDELAGGLNRPTSDRDGNFRIEGLLEREYRVRAFDPVTVTLGPPSTLRAGDRNVVLVLERDASCTRVAGRLLSLSGEPLRDVAISARNVAFSISSPHRHTVNTEDEGRFAFESLAAAGADLELVGDKIFSTYRVSLSQWDRRELIDLELAVPRMCELRVSLADPTLAGRLAVLDAAGQSLSLLEMMGGSGSFGTFVGLVDGRSSVLLVDERAATLVLQNGATEVARFPIRLDPDRRTELEL